MISPIYQHIHSLHSVHILLSISFIQKALSAFCSPFSVDLSVILDNEHKTSWPDPYISELARHHPVLPEFKDKLQLPCHSCSHVNQSDGEKVVGHACELCTSNLTNTF